MILSGVTETLVSGPKYGHHTGIRRLRFSNRQLALLQRRYRKGSD